MDQMEFGSPARVACFLGFLRIAIFIATGNNYTCCTKQFLSFFLSFLIISTRSLFNSDIAKPDSFGTIFDDSIFPYSSWGAYDIVSDKKGLEMTMPKDPVVQVTLVHAVT
jgi:hypothetical protein